MSEVCVCVGCGLRVLSVVMTVTYTHNTHTHTLHLKQELVRLNLEDVTVCCVWDLNSDLH